MRGRFLSPHKQSQAIEDCECCANTVVGAVGDFAARRVHLVELGAVEPQELAGGDDQGFEYGRNQKVEERVGLIRARGAVRWLAFCSPVFEHPWHRIVLCQEIVLQREPKGPVND
jgi:hypothetical protein